MPGLWKTPAGNVLRTRKQHSLRSSPEGRMCAGVFHNPGILARRTYEEAATAALGAGRAGGLPGGTPGFGTALFGRVSSACWAAA